MLFMRKSRGTALFFAGAAAALLAIGCGSGDPDDDDGSTPFVRDPALNVTLVSKKGTSLSHNVGQQCIHCHQPSGPGRGLFTIAGTVTDKEGNVMPGAIVQITEKDGLGMGGPGGGDVPSMEAFGKIYAQVEADDLGNFYSTEPMPFPDPGGVPSILSVDGKSMASMSYRTLSGACNLCHVAAAGGTIGFKDLQ